MSFLNVARVGTMPAGAAGALLAQSAGSVKPRFEVASIRPAAPAPGARVCVSTSTTDAGRVRRGCDSLAQMLRIDIGIPETRLVGPDWIQGGLKFDISAKLPDGATRDQIPEMFQSLLEDRFGLVFHHESKERPILALVVAKGGLKVQPAAPESAQPAWVAAAAATQPSSQGFNAGIRVSYFSVQSPDGGQMSISHTPSMGFVWRSVTKPDGIIRYKAPSITFKGLADLAATAASLGLGKEVRDMTGLKGRYEVDFEISLADLTAAEQVGDPGDLTARQDARLGVVQDGLKKLGLQLEPRKAPVDLFVIDHLEKTPTEN